MRIIGLCALLALAACGEAAQEQKAAAPNALSAGQYEVTAEVATFQTVDKGPPKINTPVGTRATRSVCVAQGTLPHALFVEEGFECVEAQSPYVRNGSMNMTLRCSRPDLDGNVSVSVAGDFTADSFSVNRRLTTSLRGEGDVSLVSRLTGRRTGDCTSAPAAPANGSNAAGDAR